MKKEVQLVKYKKESFFEKIKNKVKNMFFKNQSIEENQKIKENVEQINRDSFFEVYKKVKNKELSIDTLDQQTLKTLLTMVIEELDINDNKINEKLEKFKISLDNAKMDNKELEVYIK